MIPFKVIIHLIKPLFASSPCIVESDNSLLRTVPIIGKDTSIDKLSIKQVLLAILSLFPLNTTIHTTAVNEYPPVSQSFEYML